jgi:hypothetical protein
MSTKLDTSWFNLKNYDGLKDLDLYGWYLQLHIRDWIKFILFSYDDLIEIEGKDLSELEQMNIYEIESSREILSPYGEWEDLYAGPARDYLKQIKKIQLLKGVQRIRIDCVSKANHNLIRLLDKPGDN